jgi:hypothetical protein
MLIRIEGDYTLWASCKLQEKRPPEDAGVPNVEAGHFERKHLLKLVVPHSTRDIQVTAPDGSGRLPRDNPEEGVMSAKLRPISMNVFLIMRLREAPLSINVLATLCHPIDIFTTKGKFLLNSSVSGWSSGPNVILMLDLFIILPGSMR